MVSITAWSKSVQVLHELQLKDIPSNAGNVIVHKCGQVLLIGIYGVRSNGSLHFLHIVFSLKFVQSLHDG